MFGLVAGVVMAHATLGQFLQKDGRVTPRDALKSLEIRGIVDSYDESAQALTLHATTLNEARASGTWRVVLQSLVKITSLSRYDDPSGAIAFFQAQPAGINMLKKGSRVSLIILRRAGIFETGEVRVHKTTQTL